MSQGAWEHFRGQQLGPSGDPDAQHHQWGELFFPKQFCSGYINRTCTLSVFKGKSGHVPYHFHIILKRFLTVVPWMTQLQFFLCICGVYVCVCVMLWTLQNAWISFRINKVSIYPSNEGSLIYLGDWQLCTWGGAEGFDWLAIRSVSLEWGLLGFPSPPPRCAQMWVYKRSTKDCLC